MKFLKITMSVRDVDINPVPVSFKLSTCQGRGLLCGTNGADTQHC